MQVTVYAETYTGAHFRGFEDAADGRTVKAVLVGEERKIVDFILENFSYGEDDELGTLKALIRGYKKGDVSQFDGCGGVLMIEGEDGKRMFFANDFITAGEFKKSKWTDVGTVQVDGYERAKTRAGGTRHTAFDVITKLVVALDQSGE